MSATHVLALLLVWAGVAVGALGCIGVLALHDLADRLHYVAPVTSLAVPLVVASLALEAGGVHAALKLVLIAALLVLTGPVVTVATARAAAARSPEQQGRERT